MIEIELEKRYLVKKLPEGLGALPHKEVADIYLPADSRHPVLRIRKNGDKFEITKKQAISDGDKDDHSEKEEHTIRLSREEYDSFAKINGKRVSKIRYDCVSNGVKGEIGVFQNDLKGLVLVDFEFTDSKQKAAFKMPDFCLADVTQEEIFAGGMLCGKRYSDIEARLNELGYSRIG